MRAGCKVGVIALYLRSLKQWNLAVMDGHEAVLEDDDGVATYRYSGVNWFPRIPRLQAWRWTELGRRLYASYVKLHGRPDVIHAHSLLYGGYVARDLSRRDDVPYVVTEHSSIFARGRVAAGQRRIAIAAADEAKRKFAVSEIFCHFLDGYLGAGWSYLPNPVHDSFLMAPLVPSVNRTPYVFLHVSLLDANKAADVLIRAFARAFRGCRDTVLRVGGNGPSLAELEALAADLGVAQQVEFVGELSREGVVSQLQLCDAFVLSSRYETFGVVLVEALALGKPIVATRCGGPESIVQDDDGLLVPVDDVTRLAEAMKDVKLRKRDYDATRIRASCARRFSANSVTARLITEYREICEPRSGKRHI